MAGVPGPTKGTLSLDGETVRLFRPYRRVAAGAAGRRDHRGPAGIRRGCAYLGIDASRRTQHAVGLRELLAERLAALAGGSPVGHARLRPLLHRRAVRRAGGRRRHGLRCGGCRGRRRLRKRGTCGSEQQGSDEKCAVPGHWNKTAQTTRCSRASFTSRFVRSECPIPQQINSIDALTSCGSGSTKNAPSAASGGVLPG